MRFRGFAYIELLIIVVLIALAFVGGTYFNGLRNTTILPQAGTTPEKAAEQTVSRFVSSTAPEQGALNQLEGSAGK